MVMAATPGSHAYQWLSAGDGKISLILQCSMMRRWIAIYPPSPKLPDPIVTRCKLFADIQIRISIHTHDKCCAGFLNLP